MKIWFVNGSTQTLIDLQKLASPTQTIPDSSASNPLFKVLPARVRFAVTDDKKFEIDRARLTKIKLTKGPPNGASFSLLLPGIGGGDAWSKDVKTDLIIDEKGLRIKSKKEDVSWLGTGWSGNSLDGALNSFAVDQREEKKIVCSAVNYSKMAFAPLSRSVKFDQHKASIGLFSLGEGSLFVVVLLSARVVEKPRTARIKAKIPGVNPEVGIRPHYLARSKAYTTVHILPISRSGAWVSGWIGNDGAWIKPFLSLFNDSARKLSAGRWLSDNSLPWQPLPTVEDDNDLGGIWLFADSKVADASQVLVPISKAKNGRCRLTVRFRWKERGADAASLSMYADVVGMGDNTDVGFPGNLDDPKTLLPRVQRLLSAASRYFGSDPTTELNAEMQMSVSVQKDGNGKFPCLEAGALDLTPDDSENGHLLLRIRSGADREASGYFPSAKLTDIPVKVNYGTRADKPITYTAFDAESALEDRLHRPTDAISEVVATNTAISAVMDIQSDARFGHHMTTEIELREERNQYTHPSILFFQAKPFLYSKVVGVEKDPEGGTVLARWRNDDPDGPQWRMPFIEATLELPAQAVGEEMERGNRFWPNSNPYISDNEPIRYRFSPSTSITLAPGRGKRRFNTAPNNVFRLVDDGRVVSFRTEMAYPVAIGFKPDNDGEPELVMRETGGFLGQSVPNLPVVESGIVSESVATTVFEGDLGRWSSSLETRKAITAPYQLLRLNNSANKANFVSRIAQLHVYDPLQHNYGLSLRKGLEFEIRSHKPKLNEQHRIDADAPPVPGQTPPLRNPLPVGAIHNDVLPGDDGRNRIAAFLKGSALEWGSDKDGAFRGGVLHTIEFPSELVAVLRTPYSRVGAIDDLSFSNMGATGTMSVSFDEGRTTFTVDVQNGQISRLLKTRIGRIGIVWNRAKHIVVYERTVLPSTQFEDQQNLKAHLGWPLLRKTEEYIEPIDVVREFSKENDADDNRTGFLDEFEFVSKRIYIDSAWGEEFIERESKAAGARITDQGYQIPLWDGGISEFEQSKNTDTSWYYPKPKLAFLSRGDDGAAVRQWIEDPDEMVFYTNTVEGAGGEPNAWGAVSGIDAPRGLFRLGVLSPQPNNWESFISGRAPTMPRREALRRRRFELRVRADGAVNLQAQRSDKPMYAAISLVSVARSKEGAVPKALLARYKPESDEEEKANLESAIAQVAVNAKWSGTVGNLTEPLQRWLRELPKRAAQFAWDVDAVKGWYREIDALEKEAIQHVRNAFSALPDVKALPSPAGLRNQLKKEITGVSLVDPGTVIVFADQVRQHIDEVLLQSTEDRLYADLAGVHADLDNRVSSIKAKIAHARNLIKEEILSPLQALTDGENGNSPIAALSTTLDTASNTLLEIEKNLAQDATGLKDALDAASKALNVDAMAALDKVDKKPIRELVRQVRTVVRSLAQVVTTAQELAALNLDGVRNSLAEAKAAIATLGTLVQSLGVAVNSMVTTLENGLDDQVSGITTGIEGLEQDLTALQTAEQGAVKEKITAVRQHLIRATGLGTGHAIASLVAAEGTIKSNVTLAIEKILGGDDPKVPPVLLPLYQNVSTLYVTAMKGLTAKEDQLLAAISELCRTAKAKLQDLANTGSDIREKLKEITSDFETELRAGVDDLEKRIGGAVTEMFDEQTMRSLESLEDEGEKLITSLRARYGDELGKASTGLKLAKAIGDMPALPDLTFNVDRAEYVFDDLRNQIETSAFGARMKEIDAGLKELGINLPSTEILDQVIPAENIRVGFNKIVDGMGGLDFSDMFEKFKLPQIRKEQYQITHGVDEKNRTAWVRAVVNADYEKRQAMFELDSFGIYASKIKIRGNSEMRLTLEGQRDSTVEGSFAADWALQFGGVDLATFRDVMVKYDGSKVTFDVDPSKMEYHPSLQFISDVAKTFDDQMPAGVTLLKDDRGMPIGAEAKMVTVVEKPPPLGPVTLGPLSLEGGLSLLLSSKGQFVIRAFAGVGSKETPIFVQISWLGGGVWATGSIENRPDTTAGKRTTEFVGSVGVALGNVRAIDIAKVAKGSYSFLIFANAEFANRGGTLTAGMSVRGSARLLSIANVYLYLLLQVTHSSKGGATGTGLLSAKVKMSRFYTLRVHKAVKRKF